jgi:hypothetical protein
MRISRWARLLLAVMLICSGAVVHAQGSCPSGSYQVGDPNQGSTGCAPIPGGDQGSSSPAQHWVAGWGAIATYIPKGVLGYSTNLPTKEQAEQAALQDCRAKGGLDCKIEISYGNQCAAVVVGDPGYGVFPGATLSEATNKSLKECAAAGNKGCHILYSACSMPRRIQ